MTTRLFALCGWALAIAMASSGHAAAEATRALHGYSFATTIFSLDSGLPTNVVQAVVQTRDGYLWVATESGLARFDGARFRVYRRNEVAALPDNLIRCLFEDRDGALWIGTARGLVRYQHETFERIQPIEKAVGAVVQDPHGTIWIGTQSSGLWRYEAGQLQQVVDPALMKATDSPMRLLADSANRVWAAIDGGALVYWQDGTFHPAGLPADAVRQTNRMLEFPQGTLWMASPSGLYRLRNGQFQRVTHDHGLGEESITDLFGDAAGRLWVASRTLWVAEDLENPEFRVPAGVKVEISRYLSQDREGTYWVGTSGEGLARLRMTAFRVAANPDDTTFTRSRTVTVAPDGTVWAGAGTDPRGIAHFAPDGTVSFVPVGEGPDADVSAVWATKDGVWIGTRGTLGYWQHDELRRFPEWQNVRSIFGAQDGKVWFGAANGVGYYDDGAFTAIALPPEFASGTATAFAEGRHHEVYIGFSSQGLLKWDGQTVTAVSGLPSREIRAIYVDSEERLWLGLRRHGLAVLSDGKWRNPEPFIESFSERVSAIAEDRQGNLWLGTMRGIVWGTKQDFLRVAQGAAAEGKFHFAGAAQGVKSGVIGFGTQPTYAQEPDGTLWFAGRDGLIAVRPDLLVPNATPPPVRIETVVVDGKPIPARANLRLEPGVRTLAIDYTALSFVQPNHVNFWYRLDNSAWVHAGNRRTAFYNDLAPGRHEFNVMASNEDGVWNEVGATLTLEQTPWFYQTWWFYAVAVLTVAAAIALMYLWRTAGLRKLVARQTQQIREQMQKQGELHAKLERTARLESLGVLAGGIAHDFNNMLTVVTANVSLARLDPTVEELAGPLLAEAERGTKSAADLTQQLLTFAKGGDPVCTAVELPDVIREAAQFARHGSAAGCEFAFDRDVPPANADRGQISRVVHNLVINAAQAMPDGGVIRIGLTTATIAAGTVANLPAGSYVKLSVTDRGPGILPEHLSRIFEPYFSTKSKHRGLGLATVHSIVTKHHGHIEVRSSKDGTTFDLWLPAATRPASPAPAENQSPRVERRTLRILFMDDEEVIRRAAAQMLTHLGHESVMVGDGLAAIHEYHEARSAGRPFDVVVLDLTVPGGMGGKATLESLREVDPDVIAIVSSGYSSDPVLANYRAHGFAAVVPKPYAIADLDRMIRSVVESKRAGVVKPR